MVTKNVKENFEAFRVLTDYIARKLFFHRLWRYPLELNFLKVVVLHEIVVDVIW
jgi:hypothetical protein